MNYKRKLNYVSLMIICMVLIMPMLLPLCVKAGAEGMVTPVYYDDGSLFPVVDAAELLTDEEENALAEHISRVESQYNSAIVIVTVDTLGDRTVEMYGDDFYDYNGYGYGNSHDGILFLIDITSRKWHITTTGSAIEVFTDSAQETLIDDCKSDLSAGNYYAAFDEFVSSCEHRLKSDVEYRTFNLPKFIICLIAGFILALIPLFIFIMQLKTVHRETGASNYTQKGLSLTHRSDRFIRKSVVRSAKPKESSGSSTHTGSSGTSHGGSSGSF
ncbi:TPM domain-containing protein [Butyrivibrio sp. JL13D10]|uniref:TPM domain-containing protein n=1 Tax=Butyrivibrio sp. JL13D10 TaxID=3236815 RepID=UPI0038B58BA5